MNIHHSHSSSSNNYHAPLLAIIIYHQPTSNMINPPFTIVAAPLPPAGAACGAAAYEAMTVSPLWPLLGNGHYINNDWNVPICTKHSRETLLYLTFSVCDLFSLLPSFTQRRLCHNGDASCEAVASPQISHDTNDTTV